MMITTVIKMKLTPTTDWDVNNFSDGIHAKCKAPVNKNIFGPPFPTSSFVYDKIFDKHTQ